MEQERRGTARGTDETQGVYWAGTWDKQKRKEKGKENECPDTGVGA